MDTSTPLFDISRPPGRGKTVGYVRVSTADQNEARQVRALGEVDRLFIDRQSGATAARPELDALLAYVRDGDLVRVTSADRMARSARDLLSIMDTLRSADVHVEFVDTPALNTDSPHGRLVLTILGAVAEHERAIIRERQREGIELAKERGVYRKRRALSDEDVDLARSLADLGLPIAEVARRLDVSRQTIYTAIRGRGAYSVAESAAPGELG